MATIEYLPKEMLLEIFSHYIRIEGHSCLSRNIPRVCKRWNDVSSDSTLWKDVRAYDWNFLLNISRRGLLEHTQSLRCDNCDAVNYSEMKFSDVLKNIRDLKALVLTCNAVSVNAIMLLAEHCPHLRTLRLKIYEPSSTTPHEWDQFLTVCGATLKNLDLTFYEEAGHQHLLSKIAAKCPLLEKLLFCYDSNDDAPFPITELQRGCPRLRELEFCGCDLITDERNESLDCGFKDLLRFKVSSCDFCFFDISNLLKNSMNLEHLKLCRNYNFVFSNILEIPSNRLEVLEIDHNHPNSGENLKVLGEAVYKWRRTLSVLKLRGCDCYISFVLEGLLQNNPNPPLKSLAIDDNIDPNFLERFVQKCQNLIHLQINWTNYKGREKIKEAVEYFVKRKYCT